MKTTELTKLLSKLLIHTTFILNIMLQYVYTTLYVFPIFLFCYYYFQFYLVHQGMCQPNQFQCANRRCILKTWVCDSENDCDDGSDERNCGQADSSRLCLPVEFACKSGGQCIPKSYHCDGQTDCMDGSDEMSCGKGKVMENTIAPVDPVLIISR